MAYKSINNFIDAKTTALYEEYGAFWAFGENQFNEKKKPDVRYVYMLGNLMVPKDGADEFREKLNSIYEQGEKDFLEHNTTEEIIKYDLWNHECYYLCDPSETIENLKQYNISKEEIEKVFWKEYKKQEAAGNI